VYGEGEGSIQDCGLKTRGEMTTEVLKDLGLRYLKQDMCL
jgi:hypothetical protein